MGFVEPKSIIHVVLCNVLTCWCTSSSIGPFARLGGQVVVEPSRPWTAEHTGSVCPSNAMNKRGIYFVSLDVQGIQASGYLESLQDIMPLMDWPQGILSKLGSWQQHRSA